MTTGALATLVREALEEVLAARGVSVPVPQPTFRPLREGTGWATPVVLRIARDAGTEPSALAAALAGALGGRGYEARVSGPGFVEIHLPDAREPARLVVESGGASLHAGYPVSVEAPITEDATRFRQGVHARACVRLRAAARLIGAGTAGEVGRVRTVPASGALGDLGRDAPTVAVLRHPSRAVITLDLEVLRRRTADNPAFVVQFAHARLTRVLRDADETALDDVPPDPVEHGVLAAIGEYPDLVALAARRAEPYLVARHLEVLARQVHGWLDRLCAESPSATAFHGVGGSAVDGPGTPVWTAAAARIVLGRGLGVLGVAAPDRL